MFLSIIIPVYNSEKYLEECLNSCLNQDIDEVDYEIVCVNDGSTDNSLNILQKYADNYSNIIIVNKANEGAAVARNVGISMTKGDHIWFVDSDDFIKPNCLSMFKKMFEEGYDVVNFCAYAFVEVFTEEERALFLDNEIKQNKTYWGYVTFHIYKTKLITSNHIFFNNDIKYGEDEVFNHEIFAKAANMCQLEDAIYFYRKNPNSMMADILKDIEKQKKRLESVIISLEILKKGIETREYEKTFSYEFLNARYELAKYCFKRLDLRTAYFYWKDMIKKGLFCKIKGIEEIHIPNKYWFAYIYMMQHFKIWKRALYKKTRTSIKNVLPTPVVCFIKKVFNMPE